MIFSPRMQSEIAGFKVVSGPDWRAWNGVVADLWNVRCAGDASGRYVSPDPRLFVLVEPLGEGAFLTEEPISRVVARHDAPYSMSYLPGDLETTSRVEGLTGLRHLDLHFDEATLVRRFGRDLDRRRLREARLIFHDPAIAALAALLVAECTNPEPMHELYGDGIVNTLLSQLFDVRQTSGRRRPALSRQQLRQATDFIEANCLEPIRLAHLAAQAGLSESYFSHAFKASTGVPPHRWQMQARIRHVQRLMGQSMPLVEVAAATGFSDQAHLARVFKRIIGMTPTEWLRAAG